MFCDLTEVFFFENVLKKCCLIKHLLIGLLILFEMLLYFVYERGKRIIY